MEHGATRNFESYRKLEEKIEREKKDREDEEANNPMKVQIFVSLYTLLYSLFLSR